jgi:excisionase family DNA binding protein
MPSATPGTTANDVPLMTVREAAQLLHLHPSTVQRRIYNGELNAITIGRALRIRRDELDRFLAAQPSFSEKASR